MTPNGETDFMRVPYPFPHHTTFFQSLFLQNAAYHDIPTRQCHQIAVPYSRISRATTCIRCHLPALFRKMPPRIVYKVYAHSLYGVPTYTQQCLLTPSNVYTNTQQCLLTPSNAYTNTQQCLY